MYNGVYTMEQYAYIHDTLNKWLKDKIRGKSLGMRLQELGIRKIMIYGANELGVMVCQDIVRDGIDVLGFIDKSPMLHGQKRCEVRIYSLEVLDELSDDCYILVTPEYYFCEIMSSLIEGGISLERIVSLSMIV